VNVSFPASAIWSKPGLVSEHALYPALVALLIVIAGLALVLLPVSWVALLMVAVSVVLLVLLRPVLGLYLLVLAIPFGSLKEINVGVLSVGGAEAMAALTLAAWLAQMLAHRDVRTVRAPLLVPLLAFLFVASFSVIGALSLQWSLKGLLVWLELLAVYLMVVNLVSVREARILVLLILAAGALEALLGIYQFFGRVGPPGFVLFDRFMRAYGTFDQPNPYGGYLALILPLALSLFLGRLAWRRLWDVATWLLATVSLGLMGLALVMSWSRGAWLGFAAGAAVLAIVGFWFDAFGALWVGVLGGLGAGALGFGWLATWGPGLLVASLLGPLAGVGTGAGIFVSLRRRWPWLLAVVTMVLVVMLIALGGARLLPSAIADRFSDFLPYLQPIDVRRVQLTDENFAVVERLAHWEAALGMLEDHPLLGVGVGNYVPTYPSYALPGWKDPLGHAHNQYLNVAAETGIVGLVVYVLLIVACFWQGWSATRSLTGPAQGVALGVLGVLGAFTVHSLFDNLYVHGMNMHLAMLLGLLAVFVREREESIVQTA
jgi:putative inorganic carbon (HCO3(-)) transporter